MHPVPQGDWVCPACAAGRAPLARPPSTARDCLLQRRGLGLARIEAMWQARGAACRQLGSPWQMLSRTWDSPPSAHHAAPPAAAVVQDADGVVECLYRWYCVPEETHVGRQVRPCGAAGPLRWQHPTRPPYPHSRLSHAVPPIRFFIPTPSRLTLSRMRSGLFPAAPPPGPRGIPHAAARC